MQRPENITNRVDFYIGLQSPKDHMPDRYCVCYDLVHNWVKNNTNDHADDLNVSQLRFRGRPGTERGYLCFEGKSEPTDYVDEKFRFKTSNHQRGQRISRSLEQTEVADLIYKWSNNCGGDVCTKCEVTGTCVCDNPKYIYNDISNKCQDCSDYGSCSCDRSHIA